MKPGRWMTAWKSISAPQAIVLLGVLVTAAWLVERMPADAWEALLAKDPAEVGLRLGLFLLALVGVFTKSAPEATGDTSAPADDTEEPTTPSGPKAMRRRDAPPGDRS